MESLDSLFELFFEVFESEGRQFSVILQFCSEVNRISEVHRHRPYDRSNEIGIDEVLADPTYSIYQDRVKQEVIQRTDHKPNERERRADNTHDVPFSVAIVPEFDFEAFDEYKTGEEFNEGHADADDEDMDDDI